MLSMKEIEDIVAATTELPDIKMVDGESGSHADLIWRILKDCNGAYGAFEQGSESEYMAHFPKILIRLAIDEKQELITRQEIVKMMNFKLDGHEWSSKLHEVMVITKANYKDFYIGMRDVLSKALSVSPKYPNIYKSIWYWTWNEDIHRERARKDIDDAKYAEMTGREIAHEWLFRGAPDLKVMFVEPVFVYD